MNLLLSHYSELNWKLIKFVAPTHYDKYIAPLLKGMVKDSKLCVLDQTIRIIQRNPGTPTERLDIVIQIVAQHIKKKFCSDNDIKDVFDLCKILPNPLVQVIHVQTKRISHLICHKSCNL